MPLFKPKHQKLILQCYPPGRGFDKKPNSSELSYLLYYASTRRVKLEKVGKFLEHKNELDVSHSRTGNVQVTLEIINSLIKKCPDDLNVFAHNVNSILLSIFKTKDLALSQHAEPVFETFCLTLDGELFSGDPVFVDTFTKLSESFLNLGAGASKANIIEWKAISLRAAASIANCKNVSLGGGVHLVKKAIPIIVAELKQDFTEDNLIKRIASHGSEQHELSRFNTAKTSNVIREVGNGSSPQEVDLDELAIKSLKSFFNTSSSTKLSTSTDALLHYLISSNIELNWSAALIEMVTVWVPVQLRFIVLSVLTNHLTKSETSNEQLVYVHAISSLLSSSVNLVGLSVIDNLRSFISLQEHAVLNAKSEPLRLAYSDVIGSLAVHVYYQDQIADIIGYLLVKIKETSDAVLHLAFFDDINRVLSVSNRNQTLQRSSVPLEIFVDTFSLISSSNPEVQSGYIQILINELELEYDNKSHFLQADYNSLISNARISVINQFYESLEKIKQVSNKPSFIRLLDTFISRFGVNSIVNFVPFFFSWQLKSEKTEAESQTLLDNISYIHLYLASKILEYKEVTEELLSRIDYRRNHNLWVFDGFPTESSVGSPKFTITKKELIQHVSNYSINDYQDTIFNNHYKYNPQDPKNEDEDEDYAENSYLSASPQNISMTMLVQPPTLTSENHSIKSLPLSARSLLIGKLNVPKVQELRNVISGSSLKNRVQSTSQKTDMVSLLDDLKLTTELDSRGSLAT